MKNIGLVQRVGAMVSLAALAVGTHITPAQAATPLVAPDERIGKDVYSIPSGDLNNPGFGASVASKFFANQSSVLLTGHSDSAWPDALTIGPVAGKQAKPLFINTKQGALPSPDQAYVKQHAKEITILGGPAVVSPQVEASWRAQGKTVHRIAGANRYQTAVHIANQFWPSGADTVILARSDNPADAISGQPLGTLLNAPILLTDPKALPGDTQQALGRLNPKRIILLGGAQGIDPAIERQIAQTLPQARIERVAGSTRFDTSRQIADRYFPQRSTVFAGLNHTPGDGTTMATGQWADMLQLAPAAGASKAPVIVHTGLNHYLANPIAHTVHAYDPGTKVPVAFYEHDHLWGNTDLAWRETALLRAKHGIPTRKSCTGSFESQWQGYGGQTNAGDGSVWTSGWSATIFATSPGHMEVLTDKRSDYIRIIPETLRESHGDNYAKTKPSINRLMDTRGLAIRVGTCVSGAGTVVPIGQQRLGPNQLSQP